MRVPAPDADGLRGWHEAGAPAADTQIVTSDGHRIAAHSNVLASASVVMEALVYKPRKNKRSSERVISILGVPSDVVFAFLQFIYSSRAALASKEGAQAVEAYGVQLLVLSHKFRIDWLTAACEADVARRLKPESAVDVLQIARLCGSARLRQRCMLAIWKDFAAVQLSDGWRFAQKHDPRLELEVLSFLQENDMRRKRWRRQRGEQEMYLRLADAMDCLEHICTDGCTSVGPHDKSDAGPCPSTQTCEGLQVLIRHFAACKKPCPHCKRMRQLFRLHHSLCDHSDSCRVPLCKQFKLRTQMSERGDDATWRLLVKKVAVARAMSSLPKRKRPELLLNRWARPSPQHRRHKSY